MRRPPGGDNQADRAARAVSAPVVIVVPEPSHWLNAVLRNLSELAPGHTDVEVFAPWWLDAGIMSRVTERLPARFRSALERRVSRSLGDQVSISAPGAQRMAWLGVDFAVGVWAGDDVGRRLAARFTKRRWIDALAARTVRHASVVVAPSGAAELVFAAAPASCSKVLVYDLPCLRRLHQDLDAAAAVHPDARFLRRFRAPAREVARQEAERVLANRILVRGDYARQALVEDGAPVEHVGALPDRQARAIATPTARAPRGPRILLAGGGAARGGSYEALAALDQLPDATLVVSPGEGREPASLMQHPRVCASTAEERDALHGIDVVIAPAWCESYPAEVSLARAAGVPVVATAQAAGFGDAAIARGDAEALAAAIRRVTRLSTVENTLTS
jgi:hypothetical protein